MNAWYVKAFLALGGAAFLWKMAQGSVPKLIARLTPLALAATDAAFAAILANPFLRWFILGNKENVTAILNALLDVLGQILEAVKARLDADIAAAAAPPAPPPTPAPPAQDPKP